jgi:C1A family cysteine protease
MKKFDRLQMIQSVKFKTVPSSHDPRDYVYTEANVRWKDSVDLREWDSPVESQYQLGSCVGNAIANAYEHMVKRNYPEHFVDLSRLFIYYNARAELSEELLDAGTTVRNGLKGLRKYGACRETAWPYDLEKFDDKPSEEAYTDAKPRSITGYQRLYTEGYVIDALSAGKPVVFGIEVFEGFMYLTKDDAVLKMPTSTSISYGGHAMCLVGYNLYNHQFLAKNSFGTDWGDNGYCWIPFKYFSMYSYDRWVFDIPNPTLLLS